MVVPVYEIFYAAQYKSQNSKTLSSGTRTKEPNPWLINFIAFKLRFSWYLEFEPEILI